MANRQNRRLPGLDIGRHVEGRAPGGLSAGRRCRLDDDFFGDARIVGQELGRETGKATVNGARTAGGGSDPPAWRDDLH
jgi:hypothetical protein